MDVKKILYITYDGLTDPLGQSQILPYLIGLTAYGYRFTILSFEKKNRLQNEGLKIQEQANSFGIYWVPLSFTSKPPLISKFYDMLKMHYKAFDLQRKNSYDMVHCRSYIAADVGLEMKKKFGIRFFFDMRGFWADEKKDGGSWDLRSYVYRQVYRYFKYKEANYLRQADCIISLTNAGKAELKSWTVYSENTPVQVIPCCADTKLFSLTSAEQKKQSRAALGISENCLVLSYLGSVGTWYMLEEMLLFYKQLKHTYTDAKFIIITQTPRQQIDEKIKALNLKMSDFTIREAAREQVPDLIKASDLNVSFIRPVYSKISSSPTKLGEVLSMGIPVITNSGVGDVEAIVNEAEAGFVLHDFTSEDFAEAIAQIPDLLQKSPEKIREAVMPVYDLQEGIKQYAECYRKTFS